MRRKTALMICVIVLCSTQLALAVEFSADVVSRAREGSFNGRIFVANDKVRMEMAGLTTITRLDKNVAWVIMPQENMYMEQPLDQRTIAAAREKMPGEIERKFISNEMIGGKPSKKYLVIYELKDRRDEIYQWLDQATQIPLKTAAVDGSWSMEYKNLSIEPQAESLFEIPARYKKMSIPNMGDISKAMREATQVEE